MDTEWGGIRQAYYLLWIKRKESYFGATTGTGKNVENSPCTIFSEPANLPHGLSGIVLARNVTFLGEVTIFQHVTIAEGNKQKKTIIGKNVMLGAGSVILNNVQIGNNVKVGANAVVTQNVPDNCTVVGVPARIIRKDTFEE